MERNSCKKSMYSKLAEITEIYNFGIFSLVSFLKKINKRLIKWAAGVCVCVCVCLCVCVSVQFIQNR